MTKANTLAEWALRVLTAHEPADKVRLTALAVAEWQQGGMPTGSADLPSRPARPLRPELVAPGKVTRRAGGKAGQFALLHAIAHIELNAIDLAWDVAARFDGENMPNSFFDQWVSVASDEAKHFQLLSDRLQTMGGSYGDLPAHDGLWGAAEDTSGDLLERLAIVPMVLEARGLDVTPAMIKRFKNLGDLESAAVLNTIYTDEIGHVAIGVRWFEYLCERRNAGNPQAVFNEIVARKFTGSLKPPFNFDARSAAGMDPSYLEQPVAE